MHGPPAPKIKAEQNIQHKTKAYFSIVSIEMLLSPLLITVRVVSRMQVKVYLQAKSTAV